ncbi:hypothetical protein [Natronocalculus amylovorans]|uniref:Uncharacterized protein n=1 Tax=Natronocalculus amylovorans TaxID=2917812 RepID=A0AAE3FYH5_9EURY|nr:hypothetical protein [Natronocalculus amylovorans]MCL9817009.1 hypothetical protein [Natronocalculus amylovorans]
MNSQQFAAPCIVGHVNAFRGTCATRMWTFKTLTKFSLGVKRSISGGSVPHDGSGLHSYHRSADGDGHN